MSTARAAQLAEDRDRIRREADPIGLLTQVAKGKPVAVLDWEGNVVDVERPTMDQRVTAARELLKKVVPDLKSVDISANEGAGLQVIFNSPVPLPNSVAVDADEVVDQIGDHVKRIAYEPADG